MSTQDCPAVLFDLFMKHVAITFPDKKWCAESTFLRPITWPDVGRLGFSCVYNRDGVVIGRSWVSVFDGNKLLCNEENTFVEVDHRKLVHETTRKM